MLNYYFLKDSLYEKDFYFIYQINNEIDFLINNLENFYSEGYFKMKLVTYIYQYLSKILKSFNDKLYIKLEKLKKVKIIQII